MISTITYDNFGTETTSRLVTQVGNIYLAKARNPWGSHNLIVIQEIDGRLTAIRHGNSAAIYWAASEDVSDKKTKRALVRCFEAIGYNPLANKPESKLAQLVRENKQRYIASLEAERLGRE